MVKWKGVFPAVTTQFKKDQYSDALALIRDGLAFLKEGERPSIL